MTDHSGSHFPAIAEGLIGNSPMQTMSSREIADLCEARHNDVIATIDRLFESGVLRESRKTLRPFSPPSGGRPTEVYDLTKRDCLVVVSGYNDQVRARIIDRWIELEAVLSSPKLPDLSDPVVLTQLLMEHATKRIEAEKRADAYEAKAIAHDRIADSFGTFCRSTAAKNLGIPPHTLIRWMRTNSWTFRRQGDKDDLSYQSKIAAGFLEHKVTTGQRPDGTEWTSTQVRVTAKGMTVLAKAFPRAAEAA